MPNRELREGILTSERINALTFPAEVFYRRLMSVVDDFGRCPAHPRGFVEGSGSNSKKGRNICRNSSQNPKLCYCRQPY
jgi:hypothetical protein